MGALKTSQRVIGAAAFIQLEGGIDETARLPELDSSLSEFAFDVGGVVHVNSIGMRSIIRWIEAMKGMPSVKFRFDRVPRVLLRPLISIRGALPENAEIRSICAPFYCGGCDSEFAHLFKRAEWRGQSNVLAPCPGCGDVVALDAVAAEYFSLFRVESIDPS